MKIAEVLGNIGNERAIELLIAALNHPDLYVKRKAAGALGNIGTEKAVEPLIDILKNDNEFMKWNAAFALGNIGSEKALKPLIAFLKDQEADVRNNKVWNGIDDAIESLIDFVKNKNPDVRSIAISALGNIGSEKSVEFLIASLKDQDVSVRRNVEDALKKIGVKIFSPTYENINKKNEYLKNNKKQSKVIRQKKESKKTELPETFDALKAIAINKQERVPTRMAAIIGLGNIKPKTEEAVNLLLEILENKDFETYHFRAIQALGNTGSSIALPVIKKRLEIEEKRRSEWRKIRDEKTDSSTDEERRKRLESVKPKPYLECELAYAISRISPDTEGIKLLNHDLAAVREGAWLGIGQVGTVELVKKLYEERRRKDITPWFRHAAYRAIDHVLIHLEAFGKTKDADELEKFLKEEVKESDEPGIHTRTKWTKERLREAKNEK